ncbi:type II toxin-antitoxin system RelE/ParE family toxin [Phyllobacterium leguminum]|nr:type II toxin-antitoxin system RelE/ParE family toxin [Phyllobacterium leguminum]
MSNEVRQTPEFADWLDSIKDHTAAALVSARIERLGYGLLGDAKFFDGIGELRIDYGPGYRVYFCRCGSVIYILLCGGTKRTQGRDIKRATKMAQEIGYEH